MTTLPPTITCPRCGVANPRAAATCHACSGALSPTGYSRYGSWSPPAQPAGSQPPLRSVRNPTTPPHPRREWPARLYPTARSARDQARRLRSQAQGGNGWVWVSIALIAGLITLFAVIGFSQQRSRTSDTYARVATALSTEPTSTPPVVISSPPNVSQHLVLTTTQGVIEADLYAVEDNPMTAWLTGDYDKLKGLSFMLDNGWVQLRVLHQGLVSAHYGVASPRRGNILLAVGDPDPTRDNLLTLVKQDAATFTQQFVLVGQVTAGLAVLDRLGFSDTVVGVRVTKMERLRPCRSGIMARNQITAGIH